MKKWIVIATIAALLAVTAGCSTNAQQVPVPSGQTSEGTQQNNTSTGDTEQTTSPYLTFQDLNGDRVTLEKKPERIVILNNELTELFYQVGGNAVGIATSPGVEIPTKAADVEQVGVINSINLEKVLELKPDLVIGQPLFHKELSSTFADAGIPFAILTVKSIEDIRSNAKLFGQIIGEEQQAETAIADMDTKINELTTNLPADKPSYAIITLMMNTASLQKSSSIALDIAEDLHMNNIAKDLPSGKMPSSVPFSMEKLVELNPDYLFIVVHGTDEDGQRMIESQLEDNPAWISLAAVKSKQLHVLPPSKFVTNPGLKVSESVEYMKQLVYP